MSNYPAGAEWHPDAPWNQPDDPEWYVENMTIENKMVVFELSWFPREEDQPTRIELFEDDLYELIESKIEIL